LMQRHSRQGSNSGRICLGIPPITAVEHVPGWKGSAEPATPRRGDTGGHPASSTPATGTAEIGEAMALPSTGVVDAGRSSDRLPRRLPLAAEVAGVAGQTVEPNAGRPSSNIPVLAPASAVSADAGDLGPPARPSRAVAGRLTGGRRATAAYHRPSPRSSAGGARQSDPGGAAGHSQRGDDMPIRGADRRGDRTGADRHLFRPAPATVPAKVKSQPTHPFRLQGIRGTGEEAIVIDTECHRSRVVTGIERSLRVVK